MKKIFSIALSLILLISSIGMAKSTHFCGGLEMLSELSLQANHIDCGMEEKTPDCSSEESHDHIKSKTCCDNEFELLQMEDDLNIVKSGLDLHFDFALAFVHTFIFNGQVQESTSSENPVYTPPVLRQNHQILFQSFLI